jgi:hypothetical protein
MIMDNLVGHKGKPVRALCPRPILATAISSCDCAAAPLGTSISMRNFEQGSDVKAGDIL